MPGVWSAADPGGRKPQPRLDRLSDPLRKLPRSESRALRARGAVIAGLTLSVCVPLLVRDPTRSSSRACANCRRCRRLTTSYRCQPALLLLLGVRKLVCGRIPSQPKRPQPFSPLPQGSTLGFIVCPRLCAFPSSLLLLVLCFFRYCKRQSPFWGI